MSTKPFKPMLADKADLSKLQFPKHGSAKLDGLRCLVIDGRAMSRSMKPLPNRFAQSFFEQHREHLEGLDGELIVGSPTDKDVYRNTESAIMRQEGEPDFTYFIFDRHDMPNARFDERIIAVYQRQTRLPNRARILESEVMNSHDDLIEFEQRMLDIGYEGVMLRDPQSPYKQGRSTQREQYLLKVKRFEDAEAIITGFEEEMFNGNEATTNELGRTKRSSHQANKTGKGTLGAYVVRGLTAFEGVEFKIGTGMDAKLRAAAWQDREQLLGKIVKYKYFSIGVKDAPRHPVYQGMRDLIDL